MTAKQELLKQLFFTELKRALIEVVQSGVAEAELPARVEERLERQRKMDAESAQQGMSGSRFGGEEQMRFYAERELRAEYEARQNNAISKVERMFAVCYAEIGED